MKSVAFGGTIKIDHNEVAHMAASKEVRNKALDQLFDAVLTLKNKEDCYTFFKDLC